MQNPATGEGWRALRPEQHLLSEWVAIDPLVPKADWFWRSLQRVCVPECCGLGAYDFSAESVAWACGWGTSRPSESDWRDKNPGDPRKLAAALRRDAQEIRGLEAKAVSADLFNDILVPASYASLLDDLADKAEPH